MSRLSRLVWGVSPEKAVRWHKRATRVKWGDGKSLTALRRMVSGTEVYMRRFALISVVLVVLAGCAAPSRPTLPPGAQTVEMARSAILEVREGYTDRVMVWRVLDRTLLIELEQSRDMGRLVSAALAARRSEPYPDRVEVDVEYHDLVWSAAPGSKLGVNNKYEFAPNTFFPLNFGPGRNALPLVFEGGEGQVTVERKLSREESYVKITVRKPVIIHPSDLTLWTCAPRSLGDCGGGASGEWHHAVRSRNWTRYHFFTLE